MVRHSIQISEGTREAQSQQYSRPNDNRTIEPSVARRLAALEEELRQLHRKIDVVATIGFSGSAESPDEDNRNKANRIVNLLVAHPEVSYQEIGELVGLTKQGVHRIAKQAGLRRDRKPRHYHSHITTEKVLELYHKNLLIKDIALALGCNYVTVRNRLRTAGIGKAECYSRSMKLDWRGKREAKATTRTD